MFKKILIAVVAGAVGYLFGVQAGFEAGISDYLYNDAQLLEEIAEKKDKFESPEEVEKLQEMFEEAVEEANGRGFQ